MDVSIAFNIKSEFAIATIFHEYVNTYDKICKTVDVLM